MKNRTLIATCLIAYHISSFTAQHVPGLQTCIGTPELRHSFEQMQCKKFIAEREEQRKYYNQFPKISQEELDRWLTEKEREIKENQAKYRKEQEQQALKWSLEYVQKNRHSQNTYLTALKKDLKNNHRNKYNPQIKTIECYPPRLLLEWKK